MINPLDEVTPTQESNPLEAPALVPDMGNPMEIDPLTKNVILPGEAVIEGIPEGVAELMMELGSAAVYHAIQDASNNTERSQQRALGASALGHCRRFAQYVLDGEAPTDERTKNAAFIGTELGKAIEAQMKLNHPEMLFQLKTSFTFPNGMKIPGHPDIVIPASVGVTPVELLASKEPGYDGPDVYIQGVWDLKSKDKLKVIKTQGQTQQQIYQLHTYVAGLIEDGVLDGTKPIWIQDNYFDRSGKEDEVYTLGHWYNPSVIQFIDEWLTEVLYAQEHGGEAPKDMPRSWCMNWCEFATICRTHDTDVTGLITEPEEVAAVNTYQNGLALEKEGKLMKDSAKDILEKVEGSTGEYLVRWTETAGSFISFERKPSRKLSIVPVKAVKPPAVRKPRKKKEAEKS